MYKATMEYILPMLYHQIDELKKYKQSLLDKQSLLSATGNTLDNQIERQTEYLHNLENKIKKWHNIVKEEAKNRDLQNKLLIEQIHQKHILQNKHLHIEKMQQEVLPEAVKLAREEFIIYAKDNGKELLEKLIIKLENNITT